MSLMIKHSIKGLLLLMLVATTSACAAEETSTPEPTVEITLDRTATPAVKLTNTPRPTSTPRPATPIPTLTPTLTPTPVVYVVQEGDTLLSIAIAFDQTTEALQAANGIDDPRRLQIGQSLTIPRGEADLVQPPTPTATPLPLNVEQTNVIRTPQGGLWIMGLVTNPGSTAITDVVVEVGLFDAAGALLEKEAAYVQLDVVAAEQTAPFAVLFSQPPSSFAQYQIIPVRGLPFIEGVGYAFDVTVVDSRGAYTSPSLYNVEGTVRNGGDADVGEIKLVVVAYNNDDQIIAQRQLELPIERLKAGAEAPFEIELIIGVDGVARYDVLTQATIAE